MANVSYKLKDLEKRTIKIGYVGENDHMHVLIDCKDVFDEYPAAVPTMAIVPPEGEDYPKAVTRNGNIVEWLVKNSDVAAEGDGEFQLTFTEDNVVKKSVTGRFSVERSISGNGTAPSGIDDWLTDANEKLAAVEAATQEAEDAASHAPRVGTSGYWETWDAEQGQYVTTSTKAQGEQGDPGSPGDPTRLIDDTAGQGTTGKTWSADKLNDQFGSVLTAIQGVDTETAKIKSATVSEKIVQKETDITSDQTWFIGQYVNTDGYSGESSGYNRTDKIAVNEGDKFINRGYSNWRYVTAYNGNTAVSAKGATGVSEYVVPADVTHIIFTLYSDESMSIKTVIKVEDVHIMENNAEKIKPNHVKRAARVTFIDDDGYAEFYQHFVPIMQEYGVPMCSAYMGDVCPTFKHPSYMTEEQCKTVEQLGGEIVVHGGTSLTEFETLDEAEANVIASQNALAAHGFKSDVYVYPGSANNVEIREMMARHFKCAFKTGAPQKIDTRVNDKCVPHYFIHRCSAGGYYDDKSSAYGNYDTYTLDYFKALIDDAVEKKGWLVFMTHAWMMPIGCSYRLEHDAGNGIPADLDEFGLIEDIIEYIQTLKGGGTDIEIVTASEGFEMFQNEVQAGDYLGWWNNIFTGAYFSGYWHDKPGFAVNKIGDVDFGGVDMGAWSQKTVTVGSSITLGDAFKTFIINNVPSGTKLAIVAKDDPATVINNQLVVGICNIDLDSGINIATRYKNNAYATIGGADIWTSATALAASPGDKYTIFYQ